MEGSHTMRATDASLLILPSSAIFSSFPLPPSLSSPTFTRNLLNRPPLGRSLTAVQSSQLGYRVSVLPSLKMSRC